MTLELLKHYALSFLGTPYFWAAGTDKGGDDPVAGFDCSGLDCELMRAAGAVPYNFRTTAQGLYNHLRESATACAPRLGALAFYGKSANEISHVAFCIDETTMIEAGGGDSTTVTLEIAARQNAFVRLRPVKFRKDYLFSIFPKYPFAVTG